MTTNDLLFYVLLNSLPLLFMVPGTLLWRRQDRAHAQLIRAIRTGEDLVAREREYSYIAGRVDRLMIGGCLLACLCWVLINTVWYA